MGGESAARAWVSKERLTLLLAAGGGWLLGRTVAGERWLHLALFASLAAVPVVVRWPIASALGLYAFLIPFDSIAALGEGTTGPTLTRLVGAGMAGVLLTVGLTGDRFIRPPRAALWWSLFILWGGATAFWALDVETVLGRLPTSFSLLLVYLVAVSIRASEEDLSRVRLMTVLGGIIAAAYASYLYTQGVFEEVAARASLIAGERQTDPNQFATSLLLPLALTVSGFLEAQGWLKKVLSAVAMLVTAAGIYLTMSRGTLVALLVMILVYLYHTKANRRVWVPVSAMGILAIGMPSLFFHRIGTMYETGGAGRLHIWWVGLHALREYGIFGAGLSNFPFAYNQYASYAALLKGYGSGSHNIYLGMWVELGIIGLVLMLGAFWSQIRLIRTHYRNRNEGQSTNCLAVECACYGVLVSGLFLDIVWRKTFWLPWILLALYTNLQNGTKVDEAP